MRLERVLVLHVSGVLLGQEPLKTDRDIGVYAKMEKESGDQKLHFMGLTTATAVKPPHDTPAGSASQRKLAITIGKKFGSEDQLWLALAKHPQESQGNTHPDYPTTMDPGTSHKSHYRVTQKYTAEPPKIGRQFCNGLGPF